MEVSIIVFNKKHDVDCSYCKYGYVMTNGEDCVCDKYGIINRKSKCAKFVYEPLKRIPNPHPSLEIYSENDFKIN